jgi:hypothetical protein
MYTGCAHDVEKGMVFCREATVSGATWHLMFISDFEWLKVTITAVIGGSVQAYHR